MNEIIASGAQICLLAEILLVMTASPVLGVHWFARGDFSWQAAMTYHGVMVPAWMLVALAAGELVKRRMAVRWNIFVALAAVVGGLFVAVGSLMVRTEGLSFGSGMVATGMGLAELAALVVLVYLVRDTWQACEQASDRLLRWTLIATLAAVSISTPLGHLAGILKEFGGALALFKAHGLMLGGKEEALIARFIGSHGHQAIGGFLVAPLLVLVIGRQSVLSRHGKVSIWAACVLILVGTIAQTAIYQVSGWTDWEPPVLLSSGPNGLPLDDLVLTIIGLGELLLLPALFGRRPDQTSQRPCSPQDFPRSLSWAAVAGVLAYMISVPLLGIYIEFHEAFFGHAQGHAPGVPHDLAYIRAHLVVGMMLIPLLMVGLVALARRSSRLLQLLAAVIWTATAAIGGIGVVVWTTTLNSAMAGVAYVLTILSISVTFFLSAYHRHIAQS